MLTQSEMILLLLEDGIGLTPLEALYEAGCFRLSARIYDLRKQGHEIVRGWHSYVNSFGESKKIAQYWLIK